MILKRSKSNQIFREKLKAFHVFDDKKGYNGLFITSDDKVYGFGQNTWGCCGLGHNTFVNEPQVLDSKQSKQRKYIMMYFLVSSPIQAIFQFLPLMSRRRRNKVGQSNLK